MRTLGMIGSLIRSPSTSALLGAFLTALQIGSAGCSRAGNVAIEQGSYGLSVQAVQGSGQLATPSTLFARQLTARVVDSITGSPIPSVPVEFVQTTDTDAIVVIPSGTTDEEGYVSTKIRAPSAYDTPITIEARVTDASVASTVFTLRTNETGSSARYSVDTTNNNSEVAGENFGFVVKVVDDQNNIITSETDPTGYPRTLIWTFTSSNSWTGQAPVLPAGALSCQFTNGVCIVPSSYYLTDVRTQTKMSVGDGPGGLEDVYAKPISLVANTAHRVVIADKPNGPLGTDSTLGTADDADGQLYATQMQFDADDLATTFYAAIVDKVGNYIGEPTGTDWSVSGEEYDGTPTAGVISSYLTESGATATLTPTKVGKANLTVTASGVLSSAVPIAVDPGQANHLVLAAVNNISGGVEAGIPFEILVSAVDQQGNLLIRNAFTGDGDFTGNFNANIALINARTTQKLSSGCNQILKSAGEGVNREITPGEFSNPAGCDTQSMVIPFVRGEMNTDFQKLFIQLNWAPLTNAQINVKIPAQNGFPALEGDLYVNVNRGPIRYLNIWKSAGSGGEYLCPRTVRTTPGSTFSSGIGGCFDTSNGAVDRRTAGDASKRYHVVGEDWGGNYVADVTATWALSGSVTGEVIPAGPGMDGSYADWAPITAGGGDITLTSGTISYTYSVNVMTSPLSHFELYTREAGTGSINTVSVLREFTLQVVPKDTYGNTLDFDGPLDLNLNVSGTPLASPDNSVQPAFFASGTVSVSFTNGLGQVPNLRLPNSSSIITLTGTGTGSFSTIPVNSYTITPKKGANTTLKIRTAANNGGSDQTGATIPLTADNSPTYYVAGYDTLGNYDTTALSANWTWSNGTCTTLSNASGSSFVQVVPDVAPCSGILAVSHDGLTAQTGTVTIEPGAISNLSVAATATQTAGQAFSVQVALQDAKFNTITSISGARNLGITVNNAVATVYGHDYTAPSGTGVSFSSGAASLSFTLFNTDTAQSIFITDLASGESGYVNITVAHDVHDHFRVTRSSSAITAGQTVDFSITARDRWGNKITTGAGATASVSLTPISTPLGGQDITATTLANASSVAGTSDTSLTGDLVSGGGRFTITATQSGPLQYDGALVTSDALLPRNRADVEQTVTVNPDPTIFDLVWDPTATPLPGYQASMTNSMQGFAVLLRDQYGNVITTDSSTSVTASIVSGFGSQTLRGTTTKTAANGKGIFLDLKYYKAEPIKVEIAAGGKTIQFDCTVSPNVVSRAILRLPGQTHNPGVATYGEALTGTVTGTVSGTSNMLAGSLFTIEALAVDEVFNVVTSYGSSHRLLTDAATQDSDSHTSYLSFSSGVRSFSVRPYRAIAGQKFMLYPAISASDNATATFDVIKNSPVYFLVRLPGQSYGPGRSSIGNVITGSPTNQTAGVSFGATAYLTDAYGNLVADSAYETLSYSLTSTTGLARDISTYTGSYGTAATLSGGTLSFSGIDWKRAGTWAYLSVATPPSGVTSRNSSGLRILPASFKKLSFNIQPNAYGVSGQNFRGDGGGRVQVMDEYTNIITGASHSLTLTPVDSATTDAGCAAASAIPTTYLSGNVLNSSSSTGYAYFNSGLRIDPTTPPASVKMRVASSVDATIATCASTTTSIAAPLTLSANDSTPNVGDVVTLTGSGGHGGYTYGWHTSAVTNSSLSNVAGSPNTGQYIAQEAGESIMPCTGSVDTIRVTDSQGYWATTTVAVQYAKLRYVTSATSTTQQGTYDFGTRTVDTSATFYLRNIGCLATGTLSNVFDPVIAAYDKTGADNCAGAVLGAYGGGTDVCTVGVTFKATSLTAGTFHSTTMRASASGAGAGGSNSFQINGYRGL